MNTTKLPNPLDHYTATIRDLNTIVVTAHFSGDVDAFILNVAAAHMTINLARPLSFLDDSFLGAVGNQEYKPCSISDFYAHCDEEQQREIMIAEGKNPDEEFAKWAAADADNEEKERLFFCDDWKSVKTELPEEQDRVLVCASNSPNAVIARRFGNEWLDDFGDDVSPVEFWALVPQAPKFTI